MENLIETVKSEKKNNQMKKILTIGILIAVVLAFIISMVVKSKTPIKIDLKEYVNETVFVSEVMPDESEEQYDLSYYMGSENNNCPINMAEGNGLEICGFNGYGAVDSNLLYNVIDWQALQDDVNEKLVKKYGRDCDYTFSDFFDYDSFEYKVDKSENISNGDKITLTITTKQEYTYDKAKIVVDSITCAYEIDGLGDATVLDPFEYVTLGEKYGNKHGYPFCEIDENLNVEIPNTNGLKIAENGYGTGLVVMENDVIIANIRFYFNAQDTFNPTFKNGDKVTMYCRIEDSGALEEDYNIHIARYEKEYTFQNLSQLIGTSTELLQEDIDNFISVADKIVENKKEYNNPKLDSVYISELRNQTGQYVTNVDTFNSIYVIYSYDYDSANKAYFAVKYVNVTVDDNGKVEKAPDEYLYENNYSDKYDIYRSYSDIEDFEAADSFSYNLKKIK